MYLFISALVPFFSVADAPIIEDVARFAQRQISLNTARALVPQEATAAGIVAVEPRSIDLEEERKIDSFCCGCTRVKGGPCSLQFSKEHYKTTRASAAELSWNELNMAVMGQVMALTDSDPMTSSTSRHTPAERQKTITRFHHHGHRICRTTFLFLHNMGESRLKALKARYLSEGLVPRVHGHTGRIPPNSLVRKDVEGIISFVTQYCETNAILLPGRVPGYKRDDIQILPSTTTKRAVWRTYKDTCTSLSNRAAAYSTFCKVWRHFLRHIVVARPMTDLCWTCQQNSTAIVRSANLSEAEKSEVS